MASRATHKYVSTVNSVHDIGKLCSFRVPQDWGMRLERIPFNLVKELSWAESDVNYFRSITASGLWWKTLDVPPPGLGHGHGRLRPALLGPYLIVDRVREMEGGVTYFQEYNVLGADMANNVFVMVPDEQIIVHNEAE